MRLEYRNGYVVQPKPTDLSIWRVGKDVDGAVRWLGQYGTREWAVGEVQRRLGRKPTPLVSENGEDNTELTVGSAADVLNTLICDLDDGKFDMTNRDDLDILECQIATATDIPETADMAESLLLDLDDDCATLDDVGQRVDRMLAVLMELEEQEENLVPGG